MRTQSTWFVVAWLLMPTAILEARTVTVNPTEPLSAVREKLAADASITEVIFAEGVYFDGLSIEGPRGTDFAQHPLLIRAADGVHVVFDGARPVEKSGPHEELPGVFWIDYASDGGEYPKFWEPGTRIRYRLVADGAFPAVGDAMLDLGPQREWHVSETGRDGRDGSAGQPVRTIQFAVDRAKPGDTIVVHPGFYADPVRITRGGTKDRPIVIRAARQWKAVLDCNRNAPVMIGIYKAPYVEIRDLEIRWYGQSGIEIEESPYATVAGCKIWNAHWHGAWPTGYAVRVVRSPGFTGRDDVLFRQEHGFWFYNSPNVTLTHNTCVADLYSAAAFLYSCENSVCRNNRFTFQGNDVIVIEENLGEKGKRATFDCDHNNYGTALRDQPQGTEFDSISPRDTESFLSGGSKAIVNYTEYRGEMTRFVSMAQWREFSGLDRHTLFADPLYRDSAARDFRLDAKSPNRGAGANGATIGAPED